ncbi:G-patch domain-containing protein [Meloidogyne graminicola]|uniref:G-patch domain-containing protein n=1 Tax=Meloidogyne graminicola TaxID=189291 RepID=A0A8T0A3G6_9BILA|nr:G-patch domain-containing protein [Meloidogyne graminicola]
MSLYECIETESSEKAKEDKLSSSQNVAGNKMNLSFLKSQLEAKKALLQNAAAAQNQKTVSQPPTTTITSLNEQQQQPEQKFPVTQKPQQPKSSFKLKAHKAFPLPLDSSGAFTIIPKAFKEDKVFLFGEIMIDDEYNPTTPTDYASFKQKREQQRLKEKIAKEIAERIAREAAEEEEKRKKGAAIAPPTSFLVKEEEQIQIQAFTFQQSTIQQTNISIENNQKLAIHFGKGVSRGLGVAATIMSKMGYREGSGLGAKEQGISRALQVQRTGRNVGLIVGEEKASAVFTSLEGINEEEKKTP